MVGGFSEPALTTLKLTGFSETKTMSLKDNVVFRIEKIAGKLTPYLEESWRDVRSKLDDLNRSLADQAVPGERRAQVSELALRSKGEQAGHKRGVVRPFPGSNNSGSSP